MFLISVVTGCAVARTGTAPVAGGAAPSPAAPGRDSFHITVVYPAVTDIIQSHDSLFLLGSVRGGGGGPVHLGINGQSVPVLPNGAWIAWLPLPDDTVAHFLIAATGGGPDSSRFVRSEEHTSELQSHSDLVCRLLLEKKKAIPFLEAPVRQ